MFSIKTASLISGVTIFNIRSWEKRYQALSPAKDSVGARLYTNEQVEKLKLLRSLLQKGFKISKIANESLESLQHLNGEIEMPREEMKTESGSLLCILLALKDYQLQLVSHELHKFSLQLNQKEFVFQLVLPMMREVGEAVFSGLYSISHEHAFSSLLKFYLNKLLYRDNQVMPQAKRVVIAGIEGDFHEFGILAAALLCRYYHYDFLFLGPNLPVRSLLDVVDSFAPDLLILGLSRYSLTLGGGVNVKEYLRSLHQELPFPTKVIIGGLMADKNYPKKFSYVASMEDLDRYLSGQEK